MRRKVLSPLRCLTINDMVVRSWSEVMSAKHGYMLPPSARGRRNISIQRTDEWNDDANAACTIDKVDIVEGYAARSERRRLYSGCLGCNSTAGGLLFQSSRTSNHGISTRNMAADLHMYCRDWDSCNTDLPIFRIKGSSRVVGSASR